MRNLFRTIVMVLAAAFVLPLIVIQATNSAWAEPVKVRAAAHDGYGRIVFNWLSPVPFKADAAGGQLVVSFGRPIEPALTGVVLNLSKYLSDAVAGDDGHSVVFSLKEGFEVRGFDMGAAVVIDIVETAKVKQTAEKSSKSSPKRFPLIPFRNSYSAEYLKAIDAIRRGDFSTALRELEPLAEQGKVLAQRYLGLMYEQGYGGQKDLKTAFKWYTLAAKQGAAIDQTKLGWMYLEGHGVPKNYKTAIKWFTLAAEQGNGGSQRSLGWVYEKGMGVQQDYDIAFKWYTLAGDKDALERLEVAISAKEALARSNQANQANINTQAVTPSPVISKDQILRIQEALAQLGYEPGTPDGWMGKFTRRAIRDFQRENGLTITGKPSVSLLAQLERTIEEKSKSSSTTTTLTPQPKPTIAPAQVKDTTPPSINIATTITVDTDSPSVQGRVSDNNRVVQVIVNGVATDLRDGTFSFKRYVPASGTTVIIEAIDEWGNRSQKTVKLTRTITDTSDQLSFASLDPTKIRGQANRNAVALVIGVADYTRAPAALYADSDASVFSDYARRALGIPRSNIKVLTNNVASRTDLQVAIRQWLRGRIEEGKTDVYVFFAGHGLASSDGEDLYLLPYDGVPSLLDQTSLQRNELFDVIAAAKPKSATIFLDTCYSGLSRGDETLLASARPILITAKHQAAPEGFTVFSAASGLQISSGLDEAKHGLFSYYLMRGMEGLADGNGDRAITAGELHAYVLKNVKRQAVRLGREQEPELSGDVDRVLVRW
jgi:peptidoglycan hydrolase-like protein with peptidoglycan-binding domain